MYLNIISTVCINIHYMMGNYAEFDNNTWILPSFF